MPFKSKKNVLINASLKIGSQETFAESLEEASSSISTAHVQYL